MLADLLDLDDVLFQQRLLLLEVGGRCLQVDALEPERGGAHVYYRARDSSGGASADAAGVETFSGWSSSGNYLAFTAFASDGNGGRRDSLDIVNLARSAVRAVPLPANGTLDVGHVCWSPLEDRLAFRMQGADSSELLIFTIATDAVESLAVPAKEFRLSGWTAKGLIVNSLDTNMSQGFKPFVIDPVTGQAIPSIPFPEARSSVEQDFLSRRLDAGAAGKLTLSLSGVPELIKDGQGRPHGEAMHLWLTVTPAKSAPPLRADAARPKPPPILLIDAYRLMPEDSAENSVQFAPAQRGKPGRAQVAYVTRGDLYVSDIAVRAPSVQELVNAGETLTCPEEQQLAELNAKEMGLAILQYTQDYDEHLPLASHFHDEVFPYIKNEEAFSADARPFHFLLDGDTLASMESPSELEEGEFDLPCGRVVLYGDGHVRILKPDAQESKRLVLGRKRRGT